MQRKKTAMVDVASLLFLKGHVWAMRQVKIHPKPTGVGVHWDVNYLGYLALVQNGVLCIPQKLYSKYTIHSDNSV